MGANPKKTEFLKECISDALYELLSEKDLSKITVEDITKSAGVGRATYFRHFSSKEEALQFRISRLWDKYCDTYNIKIRNRFDINNATAFFDFNYEIKDYLKILYQSGLEMIVFNVFRDVLIPKDIHSKKWYREKFYSYGLYGLLDGWIQKDFLEAPKQMAKMLFEIMQI